MAIVGSVPENLWSERRLAMEKHLAKWTYWLGVACALISFIAKGLNSVGVFFEFLPGSNVGYMSFYKASFLLLAVAIATSVTLHPKDQKE